MILLCHIAEAILLALFGLIDVFEAFLISLHIEIACGGMFSHKAFYDKIGAACVEHQLHTVGDTADCDREESERMLGIDARIVQA